MNIDEWRSALAGLTKEEIEEEIEEWKLTFEAQGSSKQEIQAETEFQALLVEHAKFK